MLRLSFRIKRVARLYKKQQTRFLLPNVEAGLDNYFNKLILEGFESVEPLGVSKDGYGLILGLGFGKKSIFTTEFRAKDRDNLLVVSKDERMALGLFELSTMSILYEDLHMNEGRGNAIIYIIGMSCDDILTDNYCDFDFLESQFPKQIKLVKYRNGVKELITDLYETVLGRSEGTLSVNERIFFLFFGINRPLCLRSESISEGNSGELSLKEKLQAIITKGPEYGVNSIVWGDRITGVEQVLGINYGSMFAKRVAYHVDEELMEILVDENETEALCGKTAVYINILEDIRNTHFQPYEVPSKDWVEQYAEAYRRIQGSRNQ